MKTVCACESVTLNHWQIYTRSYTYSVLKTWMPSYLLIKMTIVVMTAAKKTKPPNAPNATIAPKFNLAPWDSRCCSFSTENGTFTFGDWSDLFNENNALEMSSKTSIKRIKLPYVNAASDFIVLWMRRQNDIIRIQCGRSLDGIACGRCDYGRRIVCGRGQFYFARWRWCIICMSIFGCYAWIQWTTRY